jgi:hypothetical protein
MKKAFFFNVAVLFSLSGVNFNRVGWYKYHTVYFCQEAHDSNLGPAISYPY